VTVADWPMLWPPGGPNSLPQLGAVTPRKFCEKFKVCIMLRQAQLPRFATMDPRVREFVLLALLCAFLCGVALMYGKQFVAAVFAALTCGAVVIAVALKLFY
jgi:hypothetical protein